MPISPSDNPNTTHLRLLDTAAEQTAPLAVVQQRTPKRDTLKNTLTQEQQTLLLHKAAATQSRRRLSCQSAFLKTLLANVNQPCLSIDRKGNVTQWNVAMLVWTEVGERVAIGQSLEDVLPKSMSEPILEIHEHLSAYAESLDQPREGLVHIGFIPAQEGLSELTFILIPQLHTHGTVEGSTILFEVG
jgi:transcriptional regulator with PAS, ATPase and Fis domain